MILCTTLSGTGNPPSVAVTFAERFAKNVVNATKLANSQRVKNAISPANTFRNRAERAGRRASAETRASRPHMTVTLYPESRTSLALTVTCEPVGAAAVRSRCSSWNLTRALMPTPMPMMPKAKRRTREPTRGRRRPVDLDISVRWWWYREAGSGGESMYTRSEKAWERREGGACGRLVGVTYILAGAASGPILQIEREFSEAPSARASQSSDRTSPLAYSGSSTWSCSLSSHHSLLRDALANPSLTSPTMTY